jgi:hypothetical protein
VAHRCGPTRADLDSASVTGANLAGVTLNDTNLSFADLANANLTGANLTRVNISQAYLDGAVWPPDTVVPEGWQRDSTSGRLASIPSGPDTVAGRPGWATKYLFPTERIVIAVHRHPIVIIASASQIVAGALVAAIVTSVAAPGSARIAGIVWALWAVLAAWQGWRIASWWSEHFVVTDRRMMLVRGLLFRRVDMLPLAKATDMEIHRTRFGRLLGYGDLIVGSAGERQALSRLGLVPDPERLFQEIAALIYARAGRNGGNPGP